jgi:hypothetical protein
MVESSESGMSQRPHEAESNDAISIIQRGNLKALERTLRKQWRLGQNIVLCWSADERGLLVILVPHYFLGNYCAHAESPNAQERDNEAFIRELIAGRRRKSRDQLFAVCKRLDVAPTFIKLNTALSEEEGVLEAVEELIRRYGISYVENRAVLLFDIVEFSLLTPFEQASQLNSLSYSLNSAYNKLLTQGIEINFARTTTGDGYYIWNRDLGPAANRDLLYFLLLVVADNAVARAASRGNTVPVIRCGYHIGSHYELYQAEGVNPTVFSYIVGDVTIELARMLDLAQADQILVGDFRCEPAGAAPGAGRELSAPAFISACNLGLAAVRGTQLSGKTIRGISCHLTQACGADGNPVPRRFRIVDKHGLSRHVYNLQLEIDLEGQPLALGLDERRLPQRAAPRFDQQPRPDQQPQQGREPQPGAPAPARRSAPSTDDLIDDLAAMLKRRSAKSISEE